MYMDHKLRDAMDTTHSLRNPNYYMYCTEGGLSHSYRNETLAMKPISTRLREHDFEEIDSNLGNKIESKSNNIIEKSR